jgi:DNA ligase (NAD+)
VVRLPGESLHRCLNRSCPAQIKGAIRHFASRDALDIEGLGEKLVSVLVDRGLVASPADLYRLQVEDLQELPGLAAKSAQNLVAAVERSKTPTFAAFLFALGIQHVGSHLAQTLAHHFPSLEALRAASEEELKTAIPGVGDKVAAAISRYFANAANGRMIARLLAAGVQFKDTRASAAAKERFWAGKSVVFTGTLTSMTRQEAARRVEQQGARVAASVSRGTDYLVAGDNPGSKYDKARVLGITILDEEAFLARLLPQ